MATTLLIFDFDGVILDTETPDYRSWVDLFRQRGAELPLRDWADCIGKGAGVFDVYAYLEEATGHPVDRAATRQIRRARFGELLDQEVPRPGIVQYLREAPALGIQASVASSAERSWVAGHLKRFDLLDAFACIRTIEDVDHAKPEPDLFLAVLNALDVPAEAAIAFEDSPNGIEAAKRAGLRCVAVPNAVTERLDLGRADLVLRSLAEMSLTELVARLDA